MQEDRRETPTTAQLALLGAAAGAGVIFDQLFWGHRLGLSYPAFTMVLMAVLHWGAWGHLRATTVSAVTGIAMAALSATFAIHSNPVLLAMNFILVPGLFITYALLTTGAADAWWRPSFIIELIVRSVAAPIENAGRPFKALAAAGRAERGFLRGAPGKVLLGLLVSVPLLFILVPLLTSADAVFAKSVGDAFELFELPPAWELVMRIALVIAVFTWVFAFVWSLNSGAGEGSLQGGGDGASGNGGGNGAGNGGGDAGEDDSLAHRGWDPVVVLTVLGVVELVYLAFSVIQFSYLYGGPGGELPNGLSHAEYARRGFFELATVAVINLGLLLSFLRFTRGADGGNGKTQTAVRVALSLLVVFSLNMLVSGHLRMSLYEGEYGLTYLRFFVHYVMSLMLILFLAALARTWTRRMSFAKTSLATSLLFYVVLNFVGVDRIIAEHNISRVAQGAAIDSRYLLGLSDDATPVIARFVKLGAKGATDAGPEEAPKDLRSEAFATEKELRKNLRSALEKDAKTMEGERQKKRYSGWQSFNLSRTAAREVLEGFLTKR